MSIRRALIYGHGRAVKAAPTQVTVHRITYASADDPYDQTAQHTVTSHRVLGTFAPQSITHDPVQDQGTYGAVVTLNLSSLGFTPSQYDRIEVGGVHYNITEVHAIEGAVVRMSVRGPAADPVETGDVTPPRVTAGTLTGGSLEFDFTATINESSNWRIRYRRPPLTGEWSTGTWSVSATTSVSSGVVGIPSGTYEVEIQPRDAAGNVGVWYSLGTTIVVGGLGE